MNNYKKIQIEEYSYILAEHKIAIFPTQKRDNSKLLVFRNNKISESKFSNINNYLAENSLLVFNNTKVIQARLEFKKETGAKIEIFCLEPNNPPDYAMAFQKKNECTWNCIIGNLKKWKSGTLKHKFTINNESHIVYVQKLDSLDNYHIVKFIWNSDLTFSDILENIGKTPIPPYLNRNAENSDKINYQTVYSKFNGSVAAPTAGLHFTNEILDDLKTKNVGLEEITLHVGAGTFKPVKSALIGEHQMHTEHFFIKIKSLENICKNIGNIIAVGTTSVRTLETLYWIAYKFMTTKNFKFENINIDQWESYNYNEEISPQNALSSLLNYMKNNKIDVIKASTRIIIVPSYRFKIVNGIITNFHQPKSTLLLLIAAFIGNKWKNIYDYALNNNFRFLSYGDSSILLRK